MALFSIARLTVERQRNVGTRVAELLAADEAAKRKRAEPIASRIGAFVAANEALASVSVAPKLTVDTATDRAIGGFHSTLKSIEQTFSDPLVPLRKSASERFKAARSLRRRAFPKDVEFTRGSMDSQYRGMRDLVTVLRSKESAPEVELLALGDAVDFIESLLAPYGVAVTGPGGVDVERLSDAWHEAFTALALALTGSLPERDPLRVGVLDAYERQLDAHNEAINARRRAKKKTATG
jgi:hypothetical protein